jgi:hypothetical protein
MEDKKIFVKGVDRTNDVIRCEYARNFYYITFKDGKRFPYKCRDIKIVKIDKEQLEINNKFQYFRDLANEIGLIIHNEKGESINILANNYQKIKEVSKDSILHNYLTQKLPLEQTAEYL